MKAAKKYPRRSHASYLAGGKKCAEKLRGRKKQPDAVARMKATHLAKREAYPRAVRFALRDPDGRIWRGKNIRCFVREHEALFLPQDLNWDALVPRAVDGLGKLVKGRVTVWKGWMKLHGVETPPAPRGTPDPTR